MTTLVELCAGSAAVSLRWLHPRAKPPIAYQGGKRAYADAILLAMGLRPGGGQRGGRVVLVEAGPWGEAWAHWAAGGIPDTVARLRAWASEDPRALWTRLKSAPVPVEVGERVATWAIVAHWQFGSMPTLAHEWQWRRCEAGRWRTVTFNAHSAYGTGWKDGEFPARTLPLLVDEINAIAPLMTQLQVVHGDVRDTLLAEGSAVYFDPGYQGANGYGPGGLTRADVLAIAERWRAAGCAVAVSEAEPLPLPGWHHYELGKPVGNRRTWSKQKREWLTLSRPAVGVLPFAQGRSVVAVGG